MSRTVLVLIMVISTVVTALILTLAQYRHDDTVVSASDYYGYTEVQQPILYEWIVVDINDTNVVNAETIKTVGNTIIFLINHRIVYIVNVDRYTSIMRGNEVTRD